MIKKIIGDNPKAKLVLEGLDNVVKRGQSLTRQLLSFSRRGALRDFWQFPRKLSRASDENFAEAAMQTAANRKFDLVITDIVMAGKTDGPPLREPCANSIPLKADHSACIILEACR